MFIYFQKIVKLNFIVKAKESKLIDLNGKYAELATNNLEMKRYYLFLIFKLMYNFCFYSQLDFLNSSNLNYEYSQQSATMKKTFLQNIREKYQLQKQLDVRIYSIQL